MDNFRIDITAEMQETLLDALTIAFRHNHGPARGYRVTPENGLIFLWLPVESNPKDVVARMTVSEAADFAWQWLQEQDYGPQPDHDGDNERGFRIYCEGWGYVANDYRAICAVQPKWAMFGK